MLSAHGQCECDPGRGGPGRGHGWASPTQEEEVGTQNAGGGCADGRPGAAAPAAGARPAAPGSGHPASRGKVWEGPLCKPPAVGWARQTRKRTKLSFNSMKYKRFKMHRNLAKEDTQAAGKPVKRHSHLQSLEVCRLNPKEGASGTKLKGKNFKKGPFQVLAKPWTAQTACPQREGREAEAGWSVKVGVLPPPGPASPTRSSGGPAPRSPIWKCPRGFIGKRKTLPGPRTE